MPEHAELIRLVQAVAVLDGIGVHATNRGLRPQGSVADRPITWEQVSSALAHDDPLDPAPRHRLRLLIALHRVLAELGEPAARLLAKQSRLLALPVGHPLHPGDGWAVEPVPGGVLELGVGVVDLLPGQSSPIPLPRAVAELAGRHAAAWPDLLEHAERLGGLAGRRLADTGDSAVLTSIGGCDALTLATTTALRRHLLGSTGQAGQAEQKDDSIGLRIAAPRRDRVWTGVQADDRDRTRAVWLLTAGPERGVLEPLRLGAAGVGPVQRSGSPRTDPGSVTCAASSPATASTT
jgi:hypothetical protein